MAGQQDLKLLQPHDYEELYRDGKTQPGEIGASLDMIPWNIKEPQPVIRELEQAGEITGRVLDAGCGLGDNALFFAERGYQVTGIDVSPSVIEKNRNKARERGLKAEFVVADATTMEGVVGPFDTVVDSALMHCLYEEAQRSYISAVHRICEPGARLHLLCFSDRLPAEIPAYRNSEEYLRETFSDGWTIHRLERRGYATTFTKEKVRSLLEKGGSAMDLSTLDIDDEGRLLLPSWQLTAERI
ncbi:class I SAM-dependent methyltransferase [Streptacidiphilus sp. MAP5-3]|uniref:class I SAM-dependent methyltransferase n=1 Tax=unclassified Streptacidiphilus TaxID=2643834 RepID=UPI0035156C14